ncbi:MAG: hypothetical protein E7361_01575 [Clostridiales bacterium]|nr:hypothetical protein [Clostridiales bacterium]
MINTNIKKTTGKNIIAISLSIILAFVLSHIIFSTKTLAENSTYMPDFIVATTNIRETNNYQNNAVDIIYEENSAGSFVMWANEYYNLRDNTLSQVPNYKQVISVDGDTNVASISDYYTYDAGTGKFTGLLELPEANKWYRYDDNGKLSPIGARLSKDNLTSAISMEDSRVDSKDSDVRKIIIDGKDVYIQVGEENKIYSKDYYYGYNYKSFKSEYSYKPITPSDSAEISYTYISDLTTDPISTSEHKYTYISNIFEKHTDTSGKFAYYNNSWMKVELCNADGIITNTTDDTYVILEKDGQLPKIWVSGSTYYYKDTNGDKKQLESQPEFYTYSIQNGLYCISGTEYLLLENENIDRFDGTKLTLTGNVELELDQLYTRVYINEPYLKIGANTEKTVEFVKLDNTDPANINFISGSISINKHLFSISYDNANIINYNGVWQIIEYCRADGGKLSNTTEKTNYVILEKDNNNTSVWGELNSNKYYYKDGANTKERTTNATNNALPTLYGYKLNSGLYSHKDYEYIPLKDAVITNISYDENTLKEIKVTTNTGRELTINNLSDNLYTNNYYYEIYKAVYGEDKNTILDYELYNYELKASDNTKGNFDSYQSFISTYFAEDNLDELYFLGTDGAYHELFNTVYANSAKEVITSTTSDIVLDNYKVQRDLYNSDIATTDNQNVENIYLSFGDIYYPNINDNSKNAFNIIITELSVNMTLTNSYYNEIPVIINEPIRQENINLSNDVTKQNCFWFQYLDLQNLRTYSGSNLSDTRIIEHSAGEYQIEITYNTYNIETGISSTSQNFSYSLIVDETSNKDSYPIINNTEYVEKDNNYPIYTYNFQSMNKPEIMFDASEYSMQYSYNYDEYNTDYNSALNIFKRDTVTKDTLVTYATATGTENTEQNIKYYQEHSIFTWVESGYINNIEVNRTHSRTKILANATIIEKPTNGKIQIVGATNVDIDKVAILEYTYYIDSPSNAFVNDNYSSLQFDKKIVSIVGYSTAENTYYIWHYITDIEKSKDDSFVSYNKVINEYITKISKPVNYRSYDNMYKFYNLDKTPATDYAKLEKGFASRKYDYYFDYEQLDFDYIITDEFSNLGEYVFEMGYVTSTKYSPSKTPYNTYNLHNISKDVIAIEPNFDPKGLVNLQQGTLNGGYNISIFGVKSYFNKYMSATSTTVQTELMLESENIYSDMTATINSINNTNKIEQMPQAGTTINNAGTSIGKVPNTNQVPIYFEYLCSYAYTGNISNSRIYRYPSFVYNDDNTCTIKNTNNYITSYFDKNSRPEDDGYYEIIIEYSYKNNDTNYESDKQYQVFAFVIDNSSPEVAYDTLKETIDSKEYKYLDWQSMASNNITNSIVRANWNTPNYFQYDIIPTITKENYSGVSSIYGSSDSTSTINAISGTNEEVFIHINETEKISLTGNADIVKNNGVIQYTDKAGLIAEKYYITKYDNAHLTKVPVFKLIVDQNANLDTILEQSKKEYYQTRILNNTLYPSDMYNAKIVDIINTIIQSGTSISFEFIGYKWQFMIYPTSTHLDEINKIQSSGSIWGSGNYLLKLTYGSSATSNITSRFVIDTLPISNVVARSVMLYNSGNIISKGFNGNCNFASGSNNLINEPFTLIYDSKTSGADITTYYRKISFKSTTIDKDYDRLYLADTTVGVLTDIELTASEDARWKKYTYNYNYGEAGSTVPTGNEFNPDSTSLYVFYLEDRAGNKANYYVLYDNSTPKYSVELSEKDKTSNNFNLYNIITDNTTLFWGNYKAIEVSGSLDIGYIINRANHINYQPTAIEMALKDIVAKSTNNTYLGASYKTFRKDNNKWEEISNADYSSGDKCFILIPLSNTTFNYSQTNADDKTEKQFIFNMLTGKINQTILSPTALDLAIANGLVANNATDTEKEAARNLIKRSPQGTYGFYGEIQYDYVIEDILGNSDGGFLWMNNDLTVAMAWMTNAKTDKELSNNDDLGVFAATDLSSAYATSQVYFTYLTSIDSSIPTAEFDYKYYPFEDLSKTGFYNNYKIKNISYNSSKSCYEIIFVDEKDNQITHNYSALSTNNYNADGDAVNEPNSTYPFTISPTTASNNGWNKITATSNYNVAGDPNRKVSNLINDISDTSIKYSGAGLYVFRRVYVDYVDATQYSNGITIVNKAKAEELDKDSAVRYYVYYIDRNSIIDVTNMIGSDITLTYGNYIHAVTNDNENNLSIDNNYANVYGYDSISIDAVQQSSTSNSVQTYVSSDSTNKIYISLDMPMDKYNQPRAVAFAKETDFALSMTEADKANTESMLRKFYNLSENQNITEAQINEFINNFLGKYMFDNYNGFANGTYNKNFQLNVTLKNGNNAIMENNIITENNSIYFKQYSATTLQTSTVSSIDRQNFTNYLRNDITSIILNDPSGDGYNFAISDSSLFTRNNVIISEANSLNINNINIAPMKPTGSVIGKNPNTKYLTDTESENYVQNLFQNDQLKSMKYYVASADSIYPNSNNSTLIFLIDNDILTNLTATTNPYNIVINKFSENGTKSTIFTSSLTYEIVNGEVVPKFTANNANAFISNATIDNKATKWAIVVFDKTAKNEQYKNILSNADDNATYQITIQHYGKKEDYIDKDVKQNIAFSDTQEITIDHIKPIINQIKLMEQDKFISKNFAKIKSSIEAQNNNLVYNDIQSYYNDLISRISSGTITKIGAQKYLKNVYDIYLECYKNLMGKEDNFLKTFTDQFGEKVNYWNNYYFTVDDNFEFISGLPSLNNEDGNGMGLDCYNNIYFRKISDLTKYKYSITTDDFTSTTSSDITGHSIFYDNIAETYDSSNNPTIESDTTFYKISHTNNKNYKLFGESIKDPGYYEIIERDEAGNYSVYLVHYNNNGNEYKYTYSKLFNDKTEDEINLSSTKVNEILGTGLALSNANTDNVADMFRAEIAYTFTTIKEDGTVDRVYNNTSSPIYIYSTMMNNAVDIYYDRKNDNMIDIDSDLLQSITGIVALENTSLGNEIINKALSRIKEILMYISNTYTDIALDFEYSINIYDKVYGNYVISYKCPGKQLELDINKGDYSFNVTIPNNEVGRATKIVSFKARYSNSSAPIQRDKNGNEIPDTSNNKLPLNSTTYTFNYADGSQTQGSAIIIETIDNFGRNKIYYITNKNDRLYYTEMNTIKHYNDTYTDDEIKIVYNSDLYNAVIIEQVDESNQLTITTRLNANNSYPIANNDYLRYDVTDLPTWTRKDDKGNIIYTVSSDKLLNETGYITLTIKQNIDKKSKFIILFLDKSTITSETTINELYKSYVSFVSKPEGILYNDDTKVTMYTYLPEIKLINNSNRVITTSKTIKDQKELLLFIEQLKYRLEYSQEILFNPRISIAKNNIQYAVIPEELSENVSLGNGTYRLVISNDLGYYSEINFKIEIQENIADYALYINNNLMQKSTYINTDDGKIVYHYYTTLLDATTKPKINIITNSNNNIACTKIEDAVVENSNDLYETYKVHKKDNPDVIIEYFTIYYLEKDKYNFVDDNGGQIVKINNKKSFNTAQDIASVSSSKNDNKLYIIFANTINGNNDHTQGNTISLTYYYNNASTKTEEIKINKLNKFIEDGKTYYYYEISETGLHKFVVSDLAGQRLKSGNRDYFNITLINSIIYEIKVDEDKYIQNLQNYITNNEVVIRLLDQVGNTNLYDIIYDQIRITRNGELLTDIKQTTKNVYTFTTPGSYEIQVSASDSSNPKPITHSIYFTIVNPNIAYSSYTISSAKGYTIKSVTKRLNNTENSKPTPINAFNNSNSLLISCAEHGAGYYTITVTKYLESIKSEKEFSFNVWLNDRTESSIIIASIPFGTETTDTITIRYNASNIYNNIGESFIKINGNIIDTITKDSTSETSTYNITEKGVYWVTIESANGQVIASYKLTKNEPLNATAQIIIIVVVVAVIALVVIFIILRKKTKFR